MRHDEFISRVQERSALTSREAAEGVTRATLEALGERLSPEVIASVAERLPASLAAHLVRTSGSRSASGGSLSPEAVEMLDAGAFMRSIVGRSRASERPSADAARNVMGVLDEAVPAELVREIQSALPPDLVAELVVGDVSGVRDAGGDAAGSGVDRWAERAGDRGAGRTSRMHRLGRSEQVVVEGRTVVDGRDGGVRTMDGEERHGDLRDEPGAIESVTLLDSLRGVAITGGVVVTIALWLVFGFALVGIGMADPPGLWLAQPIGSAAAAWWSIGAMAVALLVGGIAGGLGISSPRSDAALVQGVLVWGFFVIVACLMAWMDIGVDLGPVGRVIRELRTVSNGNVFDSIVLADIRGSAGYAVVGVTLSLITSCVGALIGWLLVTAKAEVVDGKGLAARA